VKTFYEATLAKVSIEYYRPGDKKIPVPDKTAGLLLLDREAVV
jgi:hypothetical protein